MNHVKGSGSFTRLAPDRVLDLLRIEAVVLRELSNRLSGVVSLVHNAGLYSCASNDWLAKATAWINHDALWLLALEIGPNPRVETSGNFTAPLDSFEVRFEDLAQDGLSWTRCVEELIRVLDEQIHAIGAEACVYERSLNVELLSNETKSLSYPLH